MTAKPHPARCPLCRKIRAAHKAGTTGRNDIAKRVGCALATVTAHAKHCGITFDRAATREAVAARQIDLRAERVAILGDLYELARDEIARLKAPTYSYRLVFKDFSETVTDDKDKAPARERLNHASTISQFMQTATKLEQIDASGENAATISLLDTLAAGFASAAATYTPPPAQ